MTIDFDSIINDLDSPTLEPITHKDRMMEYKGITYVRRKWCNGRKRYFIHGVPDFKQGTGFADFHKMIHSFNQYLRHKNYRNYLLNRI